MSLECFIGQRASGGDANGDFQRIEVSVNGGRTFKTVTANSGKKLNAQWTTTRQIIAAGSDLVIRVQYSDGKGKAGIIECGV